MGHAIVPMNKTVALSKRKLFRDAWEQARIAAATFGGTAQAYFGECLREAWRLWREDPMTRVIHEMVVPAASGSGDWFMSNPHRAAAVGAQRRRLGTLYKKCW